MTPKQVAEMNTGPGKFWKALRWPWAPDGTFWEHNGEKKWWNVDPNDLLMQELGGRWRTASARPSVQPGGAMISGSAPGYWMPPVSESYIES